MSNARRWALLMVLLAAACGGPTIPASPLPTRATPGAATSASPSASQVPPAAAVPASIEGLVESMAAAVVAGDRAGYLALVDSSNPAFALEHTRWADDWFGANRVSQYALQLTNLAVAGDAATGRMTVTWMLPGGDGPRTATYAVRFTRAADGWRYAGEQWVDTQVEHFLIHVAPGLEAAAPGIAADLPDVYDRVTKALAYEPAVALEIKLYADAPALVANTLLSLPDIRGWNEPGEALKLRYDPADPLAPITAHEFTHFICFDRAGTHRTRMPWWLDEGIASYVASSYEGQVSGDRLGQVIAWEASGELAAWASMAVFEDTPVDMWKFVYPQGYAMVRYVTEKYGEAKRNAWLAAMAIEMDIAESTPATLGLTFDALDAGFREWLRSQRPN